MWKNGRHLHLEIRVYYLFIDRLDRCPTQLNCEAFVRGKQDPKDFHTYTFDFRFAALEIVSLFSHIWLLFAHSQLRLFPARETQGAHRDACTNIHKNTHGSARFLQLHFPDPYGNGMK